HDPRGKLRAQNLAALTCNAKGGAENGLRGGRSETDEDLWPNEAQLRFKPRTASRDVARAWLLMDAPFSARFPLEVFYRVRDVNFGPSDSRFGQGALEQMAGRTNKGFSTEVFLVAWLFAEEHELC